MAAILTDFLDGYFARKLKSISNAGKILDPLADKLCVASAALATSIYGDMPFQLLILIIARDSLIGVVGLAVIKKRREIPVSNIWGKITVTVLAIVLIIYIFRLYQFYDAAFYSAIAFLVISAISYYFYTLQALMRTT